MTLEGLKAKPRALSSMVEDELSGLLLLSARRQSLVLWEELGGGSGVILGQ